MSALAWVLWVAAVWSVVYLFLLVDAPTLMGRWLRGHR
jgi:hypothetical protein